MATVVITVTDGPGGVMVTCESKNPPMPMRGRDPDMDKTTPAQAIGLGALIEVCQIVSGENVDWRTLLTDELAESECGHAQPGPTNDELRGDPNVVTRSCHCGRPLWWNVDRWRLVT